MTDHNNPRAKFRRSRRSCHFKLWDASQSDVGSKTRVEEVNHTKGRFSVYKLNHRYTYWRLVYIPATPRPRWILYGILITIPDSLCIAQHGNGTLRGARIASVCSVPIAQSEGKGENGVIIHYSSVFLSWEWGSSPEKAGYLCLYASIFT